MDVLQKISQLIEQRGWSLNYLAQKADISQSTLSGLYRRNNIPTIPTLEKICDACGITMSEFFTTNNAPVELTPEQREVLDQWDRLSEKHKLAVITLMENL